MRKIISLFQRNYDGDRKVRDEVVPGAEWVLAGEGVPTRKFDGTCCMVRDGRLFRRHDRKLKNGKIKPAPEGWEPAEVKPNEHTGHWPGWLPVGDGPQDKWHREAWEYHLTSAALPDGTYELLGPKVQGNPEGFIRHELVRHGTFGTDGQDPRTYSDIRDFLAHIRTYDEDQPWEGIVWHHPDGRMVKIKTKDFSA